MLLYHKHRGQSSWVTKTRRQFCWLTYSLCNAKMISEQNKLSNDILCRNGNPKKWQRPKSFMIDTCVWILRSNEFLRLERLVNHIWRHKVTSCLWGNCWIWGSMHWINVTCDLCTVTLRFSIKNINGIRRLEMFVFVICKQARHSKGYISGKCSLWTERQGHKATSDFLAEVHF